MAKNVVRKGEMRNAYKVFAEKIEGKRTLGKTNRKWEGNISIKLTKMGLEIVD